MKPSLVDGPYDHAVLPGGRSRWYCATSMMFDWFGVEHFYELDPEKQYELEIYESGFEGLDLYYCTAYPEGCEHCQSHHGFYLETSNQQALYWDDNFVRKIYDSFHWEHYEDNTFYWRMVEA